MVGEKPVGTVLWPHGTSHPTYRAPWHQRRTRWEVAEEYSSGQQEWHPVPRYSALGGCGAPPGKLRRQPKFIDGEDGAWKAPTLEIALRYQRILKREGIETVIV